MRQSAAKLIFLILKGSTTIMYTVVLTVEKKKTVFINGDDFNMQFAENLQIILKEEHTPSIHTYEYILKHC